MSVDASFDEAEMPQPDYERLLTLIFGGATAEEPGALDVTRADAGASQVRPAGGTLLPSAPARSGSAKTEAVTIAGLVGVTT